MARQKKQMEKPRTRQLGMVGLALLLTGVSFSAGWLVLGRGAPAQSAPEVDVGARIESLGRLITAEYVYRDVIYVGQQTRFLGIPTGQADLLFSVEIRVVAGLDLLRRAAQVERTPDGTIFVTLPAAEILTVDADESTIEQYFARARLAQLDWLTVGDNMRVVKDAVRDDAITRGIVERAQRNAESLVRGLLGSLTEGSVQIRFAPPRALEG